MKKIISLVLAILTLCSLVVFPAGAADTFTEGAYTYRVDTHTDGSKYVVIVDADGTQLSGTVTVPETLGGYPVEKIIYPGYSRNTGIRTIIIPGCVWYIGSKAFTGCTSLTGVEIKKGSKNTDVCSGAFSGCTKLEVIHQYGYSTDWYDEETKEKRHYLRYTEKIEPECSVIKMKDGNEAGWFCKTCNRYFEGGAVIPAKHVDVKDNNGYCDNCTLLLCTHKCHQDLDGILEFFWKIELFFWKLFKIYPTCVCGAAHY